MKKKLLTTLLLAAAPVCAQTADSTAPAAAVIRVTLASEYEYRGIAQTSEKPAVQLNLDWAHPSGFYAGSFVSNINWLRDSAKAAGFPTKARAEIDLFAGFKFDLAKDVGLDLGYLRYEYPSSKAFAPKPNTDEVYVGLTTGPFNLKYSHATSTLFGFTNSRGSSFTEFNWSKEIAPKWTANAQVARQVIKNNGGYSYTVYKLGAGYDLGDGWLVSGYLKATNAEASRYTVLGRDWSANRVVILLAKTF